VVAELLSEGLLTSGQLLGAAPQLFLQRFAGLLGLGFVGADTEVLISITEFKETGDLIRYGELIEPYEPADKKTQKVKRGGKD